MDYSAFNADQLLTLVTMTKKPLPESLVEKLTTEEQEIYKAIQFR